MIEYGRLSFFHSANTHSRFFSSYRYPRTLWIVFAVSSKFCDARFVLPTKHTLSSFCAACLMQCVLPQPPGPSRRRFCQSYLSPSISTSMTLLASGSQLLVSMSSSQRTFCSISRCASNDLHFSFCHLPMTRAKFSDFFLSSVMSWKRSSHCFLSVIESTRSATIEYHSLALCTSFNFLANKTCCAEMT